MASLRPLGAATLAAAFLCSSAPLAAAPPDPPTRWLRPVDGPVVRPFEEPASRYGPGHRGADLAAAPGTIVRAANDGVVSFAGAVAGTLHAVVAHGGDLRTSYSFLARVDVRTGQTVTRGDVLGTTGGTGPEHSGGVLHLGLRVGDRYIDPMQLFEPTDLTELVRLVPTDLPPAEPWSPSRERSALLDGLEAEGGGPAFVDKVLDGAVDAGRAVVDGGEAAAGVVVRGASAGVKQLTRAGVALSIEIARLAEAGWHRTALAGLTRDLAAIAAGIRDWWRSRDDCSADSAPADGTGGSGHLLMAVAGINSSTDDDGATFALDIDALGYHATEVEFYSYAGDHGPYEKPDTWGDLLAAGERLGEQLKAMHAANPGREIDLVAHSQGGVVVDVFLQHVYDAADPAYPPIGTVVTLASPHEGAPLATVAGDVRSNRTGRAVLDVAEAVLPLPPSDGASTRELAKGSELMNDLWAHRLPDHVDFTSIGGADDYVVPATQIDVPGGTEVLVDVGGVSDHSAIPDDPRALQVVRAALEGRPPPCVGALEGLRGAVDPVVITRVEHTVGDVARIAP
jgi:hypothetical protein